MNKTKLIISGPAGTKEVILSPKGVTLGRDSNCDVVLGNTSVSRVHARIYQDPFGRWIVEDLDSHNGVLIEAQRIKAQAVLPNQKISIHPFELSLLEESGRRAVGGTSVHTQISVIDVGPEEDIVSHTPSKTTTLSPALMKNLNELTSRLLELSSPSELYSEACSSLAKMLDTLVAIVRLPYSSEPLPESPEILTCHFGAGATRISGPQAFYLHFSKRVLEAVRSADAPVMASSRPSTGRPQELTVVDEHEPHLVFAARVNDLGESIDALYIDILEKKSSEEMFDFVEAASRQIDFAQKNLFLTVLKRQEKELREANVQLKEKDRIKDEYVSRVTHDIKGHLAAIRSCLYISADESYGSLSEKQSDFLGRASDRTTQLTNFVKELLDLTRMRLSGQLQMDAFSLPDCISRALAGVDSKAKEKSITVTSNVDPSVGQIVGNEFSINEMISNLLFNAVKYTPENKTVHLEAKCDDDYIQVNIADTGIGIPADEVEHIFDEFFRASNAREREKDGTGLGLSIVKQIVERHGGRISAKSQEGQGTEITVVLPKEGSSSICS
jgi:signal transduction histidine kinase/pSer/pThr/pTyr-binding forkhead associated (FHA) protein